MAIDLFELKKERLTNDEKMIYDCIVNSTCEVIGENHIYSNGFEIYFIVNEYHIAVSYSLYKKLNVSAEHTFNKIFHKNNQLFVYLPSTIREFANKIRLRINDEML